MQVSVWANREDIICKYAKNFLYISRCVTSEYSGTLVGSRRGLPNPVNGNPRQKFASKLTSDGKQVAAYVPSQSVP